MQEVSAENQSVPILPDQNNREEQRGEEELKADPLEARLLRARESLSTDDPEPKPGRKSKTPTRPEWDRARLIAGIELRLDDPDVKPADWLRYADRLAELKALTTPREVENPPPTPQDMADFIAHYAGRVEAEIVSTPERRAALCARLCSLIGWSPGDLCAAAMEFATTDTLSVAGDPGTGEAPGSAQ
jgi:hypothetical protein